MRKGFALPLVLVGGFLLASLVITFHFVSASDSRGIARLERGIQAGLLADMASDEIADKISAISYGPGDAKPQWVTNMLSDLATARKSAPPFKVSGGGLTFTASDLPLTTAAAGRTNGLVALKTIKADLGPFLPISTDTPLIYKDAGIFKDDTKDVRAWDLRGPLGVSVTMASEHGPFDFSQDFRRGQELILVDTSPPASEFTLFTFLPPPSSDYALSDLQSGGKLEVNPAIAGGTGTARLFVRGPLFMLPEEAPAVSDTQPFLQPKSSDAPQPVSGQTQGPSYPDGSFVGGMAAVPGPRVLHHTDGSASTIDQSLSGIETVFDGSTGGLQPRRAQNAFSNSRLKTDNKSIFDRSFLISISYDNVTVPFPAVVPKVDYQLKELSLALSNNFADTSNNSTFDTIDQDTVAFYPPAAYLYAPLAKGGQRVSFLTAAPNTTVGGCYRGVKLPLDGQPDLWDGTAGKDGDAIVTEPVPRGAAQPTAANASLVGVYGVALFESKTVLAMPILNFALWMMQKFIDTFPKIDDHIIGAFGVGVGPTYRQVADANKDSAAHQTLAKLGLSEQLTILIRRFRLDAALAYPASTTSVDGTDLKTKLGQNQALLAPYGSWFHEVGFWRSNLVPGDVKTACSDALKKASYGGDQQAALTAILPKGKADLGQFTADFSSIDSGWPQGGMPSGDTPATKFRTWLCGDYAKKLMTPVLGGRGGLTGSSFYDELIRCVRDPHQAIAPLATGSGKRPQGVNGDYLGPAGAALDTASLQSDFPAGFFPPKYRDWDHVITRRYPTMDALINAEAKNGALDLRGAVLVETMDYHGDVTYRGRGIIVCSSDDKHTAALDGKVGPVQNDAQSLLVLVHRTTPDLLKTGKPPQIKLGSQFRGAVYSDSGVKPSTRCEIYGNLTCGLLAKGATGAGDTLHVEYDKARMDCPPDKITDRWTVEMTGEVTSVQPPP